jgi:hypothetical protein
MFESENDAKSREKTHFILPYPKDRSTLSFPGTGSPLEVPF